MKVRCVWYRRQMERHVDGAEGLPSASPLARHLEACAGCRAAWLGLSRFSAELRQALVVPTTLEGFEERAWARMPMATRRHRIPSVPARFDLPTTDFLLLQASS